MSFRHLPHSSVESAAAPSRVEVFYGVRLRMKHVGLVFALLFSALGLLFATGVRAQDKTAPTQKTQEPAPPPDDADYVERIETDLTNILLTAIDGKRRFVTTLRQEDIRVLEDGVPQQVSAFQRETDLPLSLALLIDTSSSQEKVLKDEQEAARAFVHSVLRPQKDNAAVISFTGVMRVEQPLTNDLDALDAAVGRVEVRYTVSSPECQDDDVPEEVKQRCLTGVWDSIYLSTREVLAHTPEHTRRAVILLSDGDDTSSKVRLHQAVEYAVKNNTVVYSIGIRDRGFKYGEMRRDYLRQVSEQTGGRAFFPKDREGLAAAFAQIGQELRSQYLISYPPSNRARDGRFRKIEVEIVNPALRKEKLRLLYRQGYYARGEATPVTSAEQE